METTNPRKVYLDTLNNLGLPMTWLAQFTLGQLAIFWYGNNSDHKNILHHLAKKDPDGLIEHLNTNCLPLLNQTCARGRTPVLVAAQYGNLPFLQKVAAFYPQSIDDVQLWEAAIHFGHPAVLIWLFNRDPKLVKINDTEELLTISMVNILSRALEYQDQQLLVSALHLFVKYRHQLTISDNTIDLPGEGLNLNPDVLSEQLKLLSTTIESVPLFAYRVILPVIATDNDEFDTDECEVLNNIIATAQSELDFKYKKYLWRESAPGLFTFLTGQYQRGTHTTFPLPGRPLALIEQYAVWFDPLWVKPCVLPVIIKLIELAEREIKLADELDVGDLGQILHRHNVQSLVDEVLAWIRSYIIDTIPSDLQQRLNSLSKTTGMRSEQPKVAKVRICHLLDRLSGQLPRLISPFQPMETDSDPACAVVTPSPTLSL